MFYKLAVSLAFLFSKIVFRLEINGAENIPSGSGGGFILASNHASYVDPAVLAAACPRQIRFMARHDLFKIPVFGAFINALGAFSVKRDSADLASIKNALDILSKSKGLLIFPEGSRSLGKIGDVAEPGISFIASKSRVPVIPVFIEGSDKAFGRHARFIRPFKIKVHFGQPIFYTTTDASKRHSYEKFAAAIMQAIKQLSKDSGSTQ